VGRKEREACERSAQRSSQNIFRTCSRTFGGASRRRSIIGKRGALTTGPPDLKELANETSPQELFWVIKNGINMTGMPSFGAIDVPDQEIWSIVAFVKKLPTVSDEDFKTWTRQ
jgi:hypothetical protein